MKYRQKDPDDTIKMVWDWSDWLGSATIASVAYDLSSGISQANSSNTNTTNTNYISGGVLDGEYFVKATITTDDAVPRIESRTQMVRVVRKC